MFTCRVINIYQEKEGTQDRTDELTRLGMRDEHSNDVNIILWGGGDHYPVRMRMG